MDFLVISLLLLVLLLFLILAALVLLALREYRSTMETKKEMELSALATRQKTELAQTELVSKAVGLLAAKDGMTYQAIQSMEPTYSEPPDDPEVVDKIEASIDDIVNRFYANKELTEEENERLSNFAGGNSDAFVR